MRGITDNASVATGEVKETTAVRILQVIQELSTGGAESIVRRLIATAVEMGDDAAVACAGDPHVPSGVECFSLPILRRRPTLVPDASRRLRRAIDAFKPDVVHCHNPGMAVITAVATRRGRIVPAAVTVHGMPPSDERRAARLLRLAGLPVVACGPGVAASLASHRIDVLCTIVNGVVPPPPPADREAACVSWNLAADFRLVLSVGRLAPQKRHDLAVHAVARIPEAALVVLGEGPLRRNLEGLALELGVAQRVRFPGAHPNPRTLVGIADAVVHPSDWEGMPLAVVEAMSVARPIVATAVPGTRELLRDGVDGLLVPAGDATALSEALRRVLDDPDLARRLGSAAADRWASEFDDTAMLDGYWGLWSEFADRHALERSDRSPK